MQIICNWFSWCYDLFLDLFTSISAKVDMYSLLYLYDYFQYKHIYPLKQGSYYTDHS